MLIMESNLSVCGFILERDVARGRRGPDFPVMKRGVVPSMNPTAPKRWQQLMRKLFDYQESGKTISMCSCVVKARRGEELEILVKNSTVLDVAMGEG